MLGPKGLAMRTTMFLLLLVPALAGCSTATRIVAAPFHIAADVVRVTPVVGDVVAAPLDITGNVID
jgi:hypothetical protein